MSTEDALPAARLLDVTPFKTDEGEVHFALHDSSGIAPKPLALAPPGYFVLAHLDGQNTHDDIRAAFVQQFGQAISKQQIQELVGALDEALMLDTQRFEDAYQKRRAAYLQSDVRDNRHRWPDAPALGNEIQTMLQSVDPATNNGAAVGLIAPHLDYARGGPCYAEAYSQVIAARPFARVVILGTNHFGRATGVVATTHDFQTPLGLVHTDRKFITRVETRLDASICEDEFDHQAEHSIELQLHIFQLLQLDSSFEIVPLLCPDPSGLSGTAPSDGRGPDLDRFCEAVRETIAEDSKRTIVVASADLSHVGQRFGEPDPTTPEFLERVEQSDGALLARLGSHDAAAFVEDVRATGNATRICSVGCIYSLLRILPDARCSVLRYHQAVDMENETHVTCAAAMLT